MITAVDTNILIDIFNADLQFGKASAQALRQCLQEGAVYICEAVWAEVATVFSDPDTFLQAIHKLGIQFSPMTAHSASTAADAWRLYRQAGGKRDRMVADFLIGAHATVQCERLLTRDRGFYRQYFQSLNIFNPAVALM